MCLKCFFRTGALNSWVSLSTFLFKRWMWKISQIIHLLFQFTSWRVMLSTEGAERGKKSKNNPELAAWQKESKTAACQIWRAVHTTAGPSAHQACTRCCIYNRRRACQEKSNLLMIKRCLILQSSLAVLSPSDMFLASSLQTVAVVSVEERNNGFSEASALGLLFLLNTGCYQGTETERELLLFEDVTFGLPHRKDCSATNPAFLEEWHFPEVVVQLRQKEDR